MLKSVFTEGDYHLVQNDRGRYTLYHEVHDKTVADPYCKIAENMTLDNGKRIIYGLIEIDREVDL